VTQTSITPKRTSVDLFEEIFDMTEDLTETQKDSIFVGFGFVIREADEKLTPIEFMR
jgi:hypothetical protein